MDEREDFSTRFFQPETADETDEPQYYKEEGTIYEAPEEIEIETDEVNSYPEKCL